MNTRFTCLLIAAWCLPQFVESVWADKFFNFETNRSGFNITIKPGSLFKGGASNGRSTVRRRQRIPFPEDEARPQPLVEVARPVPFSIDPRWVEWSSNAVVLVDAAKQARDAGDFLEASRLGLKLKYGEVFAKYHEERSPESSASKWVEQITADRAKLLKQRETHVKFQNSEAVAKLDQQISGFDFDMRRAQARLAPLSSGGLFDLLDRELNQCTAAYPIFLAAFGHFRAIPTSEDSAIKRFIYCRECLANAYSYATSPPHVMQKMLQQNAALKRIQDDLLTGRIAQAQQSALAMWKALLE